MGGNVPRKKIGLNIVNLLKMIWGIHGIREELLFDLRELVRKGMGTERRRRALPSVPKAISFNTKMFIHGSNDSLARNSYDQTTVMVLSSLQQLTHFLPIPLINCNPINVTWSIVGYKALRNTQGAGTVLVQNQRINLQVRGGCRSSATWTRLAAHSLRRRRGERVPPRCIPGPLLRTFRLLVLCWRCEGLQIPEHRMLIF